MNCPICRKPMKVVSADTSYDRRTAPEKEYDRTLYVCRADDTWISVEVPKMRETPLGAMAVIHPQVLEYDPGDEWAEGELWPTDEDISPPTAPASRTERNSSSTLSVAITSPPVR